MTHKDEYHDNMVTMLELIWGEGYMAPGGPGNVAKMLDGFDGKLTSSKWAKLTKCSQDTAIRDIQNLIEHGVFKKDPGGGRSTSYSFTDT